MTPDALDRAAALRSAATSDFDLNARRVATPASLRAAAVLIGVQEHTEGPRVVLTKRSSHLKHHPGQIALPGGKLEMVDRGPEDAALREAGEEVGLDPAMATLLGCLAPHETVTGFGVTPVLARIAPEFAPRAEPGEVEEVFFVPLAHLLDTGNYRIEERLWRGSVRRFYAVPYGPHYIWGATARILRGLADRMAQCR